eukprot:COSAG05_NODE_529_length_8913_cov_14.963921_6_plen_81_part_00
MVDNGLDLSTKGVGICQGRSAKLYAEFMQTAEWGNRLDRPMTFNQLNNMVRGRCCSAVAVQCGLSSLLAVISLVSVSRCD